MNLLGPRGLTRDPDLIGPWLTDWRGRFTGKALAMASPSSTDEAAALMRLCAAHRVPVVPQGGNSGMSGGATPSPDGRALLLSTRRMAAIRAIDPGAATVTCEAGVVLQTLHEAAEAHGMRFPLSLGGKGSATIGGLIATNAGGTQVLRHGSMRALVLGLEAVLADGSVWSALTPLRKDNRGFDLKQLFIGSEGTLGIVTAATLKLVPGIGERVVVWCGVRSLHQARALLLLCQARMANQLEGFEILPQSSLDAVLAHQPGTRSPLQSPHPWHVLIELVSEAKEPGLLRERVDELLAASLETGALTDAAIAASESQAEAMWALREGIPAAQRAKGEAVQHDISVPVERMPEFVEVASQAIEAEWPGTRAFCFGHLGDGNVHFHVIAPDGSIRGEWEQSAGKAISRRVHDLVNQWHGSISAEHGIGQLKLDELERLSDPVALAMMRKIKAALDPAELLNPGKLVTLAPQPAKP